MFFPVKDDIVIGYIDGTNLLYDTEWKELLEESIFPLARNLIISIIKVQEKTSDIELNTGMPTSTYAYIDFSGIAKKKDGSANFNIYDGNSHTIKILKEVQGHDIMFSFEMDKENLHSMIITIAEVFRSLGIDELNVYAFSRYHVKLRHDFKFY